MEKFWAHSGDAHFLEPEGFWKELLPPSYAERMPRAEKISDDEEIVYVDGSSIRRPIPHSLTKKSRTTGMSMPEMVMRAPGTRDLGARLADLDAEGIWAEVIYGSLGLWENLISDRELIRAAAAAQNEWKVQEIRGRAPDRLVPAASIPVLSVDDAVAELHHAKSIGLHVASLPTTPPRVVDDWNHDSWEPLWAAAEEAEMVLGFHTCNDGWDDDKSTKFHGPGGAVLNYVVTGLCGQILSTKLVTSGALDRHPNLKILISEGGATWIPFIGDRMNEGYLQHGGTGFVRPKLSRLPKEILYSQVYTSFQHDESAVYCPTMGYHNVLWGSDYPHLEGTYGHTQETLHELFDDVDSDLRERITRGTFKELFPHVSEPFVTA